jgi:hypothetical protein
MIQARESNQTPVSVSWHDLTDQSFLSTIQRHAGQRHAGEGWTC